MGKSLKFKKVLKFEKANKKKKDFWIIRKPIFDALNFDFFICLYKKKNNVKQSIFLLNQSW